MKKVLAAAERLDTLPTTVPEYTLGWEALAWAAKYLVHPNGPRTGKPWVFTDRQARFVLNYYAIDSETGRFIYGGGMRRLAKGSGKSPFAAAMSIIELLAPVRFDHFDPSLPGKVAGKPVHMPQVQIAAVSQDQPLALDTPINTLSGWKTVGDLQVGDFVFDSSGNPAEIKRTTPVFYDRDCFEVVFDDGEKIVADAGHGWTLEVLNGHQSAFETLTLTTRDLFNLKKHSPRRRMRIPLVTTHYPAAELKLDPWRLGYWLGDGCRANAVHAIDWRYKDELEALYRPLLNPWEDLAFTFHGNNTGTMNVKRKDGICPRGHDYLHDLSNQAQQKGNPACRKCVSRRVGYKDPLLPSMREVLREIGVLYNKHIPTEYLRASVEQRWALLQGLIDSDGGVTTEGRAYFVNTNPDILAGVKELLSSLGRKWNCRKVSGSKNAYRIEFRPESGDCVARYSYKAVNATWGDNRRNLSRYRRIKSVNVVDSVPVRCIGIDTPDHLFLAGRRGILTHNTLNTMRVVRAMTAKKLNPALHDRYSIDVGKTQIYIQPEGSLEVLTSSAATAEGAACTFVVADELEHWTPANGGVEFYNTLMDNLTKSGSRMMGTLNAWKPGIDCAAELSFKEWCDREEGKSKDQAINWLMDVLQAPPDTDLSDEASLRGALEFVYADCPWADIPAIMSRIWATSTSPDDARRKYMNWPTASSDSWVDPQDWAAMARPEIEVADGERIVMFFDGSLTRDMSALVGCRVEDGHVFLIGSWDPGNSHEKDKPQVDVAAVDAAVERAFERWNVVAFFADVKEWESFTKVIWPGRYKDRLKVWAVPGGKQPEPIAWDMRSRLWDVTQACELVEREIIEHSFTHDGSAVLSAHVRNCRRSLNRFGVSVKKETPNSRYKIDAAVCMIGARMARRMALEVEPDRVHSGGFYGF